MKKLLILLSIMTAFEVCATTKARYLRKLTIGMTEDEVVKILGNPDTDRASYGNHRVLEYYVEKKKSPLQICVQVFAVIFTFGLYLPVVFIPGETDLYWMEFQNGKLIVWRKEGDFPTDPTLNINQNINLTNR